MGILAIEALASWSNVESFLLKLFVDLFGGNGSLAADVFLALEGQSAKNAAINAAATSALADRPQELRVLRAILALAKTNEKDRNKLAHWTWGESPGLEALLLVDPRATVASLDTSKVYVYREADFRSIIESNDRLCSYGLRFKFILNGHVANRDGCLLKELEESPEIKARLQTSSGGA
ncbi:hypothetical protein TP41_03305 [Xanthomonas euvesicatoria pv. citrumelonis]|nr:hypothetical protein TP41_03305 [Xanthomonas euvesicatoria pv. citrumelonis]